LVKKSDLDDFKDMNINFDILDSEKLNDLTIYGENPVDPGAIGSVSRDIFRSLEQAPALP
jgi:hypothetical protein